MIATAELERKYACKAPKIITTEQQHADYITWLRSLQREKKLAGEDLNTAQMLVLLIKDYESKAVAKSEPSPVEVLKELMSANDLRQKDLAAIFGGESVVSNVLSGERPINLRQIYKLARHFNVSPAAFI